MLLQHEPSDHAACTKMIVELSGSALTLGPGSGASLLLWVLFFGAADLANRFSEATPSEATLSAPKKPRRSTFFPPFHNPSCR